MKRLGKVLEGARKGEDRYRSICASAILLLILTGCRCSEIMTAQWRDISGKRLRLRDSKTGPRTVWLGPEARRIIDELPRWKGIPHLFWNPVCARPTRYPGLAWQSFQSEAGLSGVRLHDLRHTYASQAAMGAETLPMIARLLGHANVKSTARYAHHDDAHVLEAVQRIGDVVAQMIGCQAATEACFLQTGARDRTRDSAQIRGLGLSDMRP
jgi:integrase